jgi:hypothetical protein
VRLEDLAAIPYELETRELEPGLLGLHRSPKFAIGQWTMIVQTTRGNLMWDPPNFIDDNIVEAVQKLGGVAAIAASHPHMFGAQVSWSHEFDGAPVWVNADDERWLCKTDPVIRIWRASQPVLDGITLVQAGGHFRGSAVAHWRDGAAGRGAMLTGDTIAGTSAAGWVSFMRSYLNKIPLSAATVERIVRRLEPYDFDSLYTLSADTVQSDAKQAVRRSADRYISWIRGDHDDDT